MSFSLLHVPKKATLIALRTLIAGTSCTLLLITEDRRRRINQARGALRNAEKIRSSKQYHAARVVLDGQSSVVLKDFDDLVSAAGPESRSGWMQREGEDSHDGPRSLPGAPNQPDQDAFASFVVISPENNGQPRQRPTVPDSAQLKSSQQTDTSDDTAARPPPLLRVQGTLAGLKSQQPSLTTFQKPVQINQGPTALRRERLLSDIENIDVREDIQRLQEAIALGDTHNLQDAVAVLRETLRKERLSDRDKSALVQVAVSLCVKCQQVELMDHASRCLYYLVSIGSVAEAEYYAANPQPIVDHAIAVAEAEWNRFTAASGHLEKRERRELARNKLARVIKQLLPMLVEGTLSPRRVQDWVPTAVKVMGLAFDLDMAIQASSVYWRIQHYNGDPTGLVTRRFMERQLEQTRAYRIMNTFHLVRYRLAQYDADNWWAIGDLAAAAAEMGPGQDPAKLLRDMVEFCPVEGCSPMQPLRTTWVTKLLYCHWQRESKYDQTFALFQEFQELGGLGKVVHVDGPYRVMIQIAVQAERWADADKLLKELLSVKPSAAKEDRIVGLLALAKAKVGDWNGVWEDFKRMEVKDQIDVVFAPVLHEFIKTHTTKEIEDFLRTYTEGLGIPISSFMANMVANRYGDVRDAQSFTDWLAYCSSRGFEIDAAFGNAILTNCRRRWDFGLADLKLIYKTLHALSPNFVDGVTEHDMIANVLRTHRRAKPSFIKKEVTFVLSKTQRGNGSGDVEDLRVGMRHAFATRNYKHALFMYKSACKRRLPVDDGHLRIAVKSCLQVEQQAQSALTMIRHGRARGIDVSTCVAPIFLFQIRRVFGGGSSNKDSLLRRVQSIIGRFEDNDLHLGHQELLRVAHLLLRAKHFQSAISFGLSALQRKGITYPDDVVTFQLLIQAYAYQGDAQGMKWTIAGAFHTHYYHKKGVFSALKDARKLLLRQIQTAEVKKALWVVEEGLDRVRLVRLNLAEERKSLERTTMEVMKQAALESDEQLDDDALKRRRDILQELDDRLREEEMMQERIEAERRADMTARRRAAEELSMQNQEAQEMMAKTLLGGKHEILSDF